MDDVTPNLPKFRVHYLILIKMVYVYDKSDQCLGIIG